MQEEAGNNVNRRSQMPTAVSVQLHLQHLRVESISHRQLCPGAMETLALQLHNVTACESVGSS